MQNKGLNRAAIVALAVAVAAAAAAAPPAVAQEVVTRGDVLGDSPVVDLALALHDPSAFAGEQVILEGTVVKACPMKGCWMELAPAGAARGIRVTFQEYGFFPASHLARRRAGPGAVTGVPFQTFGSFGPPDVAGRAARLEGTFETNVFSRADADHLIAEGVALVRNPDGTATELSFVASGVELRTAAAGQ